VTLEAVVEARGVGRRYRSVWAVRGVDLTVRAGEMVGIVGPDGAGKTTLLQMCAAILDPNEGACRVLGFDTVSQASAVTARIGYMSQGFTLYDRLSVEENLRFAADVRGVSRTDYEPRRERLLAMAGLGTVGARPAGKLSGGMRKKLSLCTNLIHEPRVLILDEPGLGVDPLSRNQLWTMLAAFRERGVTILVATSYMDEAERCDRVLLLRGGAVLADDRPDAVRAAAAGHVFEVAAGQDPVRIAAELEQRSDVFGVQVLADRVRFQQAAARPPAVVNGHGAQQATPTLEDVFVLHGGPAARRASAAPSPAALPRRAGIRAEALTVTFGGFRAVDSVSIGAEPGELLALLGPNGAGKTTLIRAFCGLVPIAGGAAWLGEARIGAGRADLRQRIGYMSQRFSLYLDLTRQENLTFFASAYGLKRGAALEAIRWACSVTDLEVGGDGPVAAMSGAERQRLALACGILHRPCVLFLDEPTSGVDPVSRYRFWQLIRMLAGAGMTVVVTTHYLNEAEYCDRIGLMHRARLIAHGSLAELRAATGNAADASVEMVFIEAIRQAGMGQE
jgi:ABC-2 type transport system ATP-binding protein